MLIRLDYSKSNMPLKKIAGSTSERLASAREKSLLILDQIKEPLSENKFKPTVLKRLLVNLTGKKIPLDIFSSSYIPVGCGHNMPKEDVFSGYFINTPASYSSKIFSYGVLPELSRAVLEYFTEVSNPKFFKRYVSLLNSNAHAKASSRVKNLVQAVDKEMNKVDVDQFLEGLPPEDRIDWLQYIRYALIKRENSIIFESMLRNRLKKNFALDLQAKVADLGVVQGNRKLVSEMLLNSISEERSKLKSLS